MFQKDISVCILSNNSEVVLDAHKVIMGPRARFFGLIVECEQGWRDRKIPIGYCFQAHRQVILLPYHHEADISFFESIGEKSMSEQEVLLTPSEVAALFRVDPKTVTRWAKAGKLTSIRTLGGHRRYKESEVKALLKTVPGANPEIA